MAISVNLWSHKDGEIKSFLEKFYDKKIKMDEDVNQWIYVYNKPLEAVDLISAIMDNNDKYQISICIQVDEYDLHPITYENHNDVIKGMFYLYYEEGMQAVCQNQLL